MPKGIFKNGNSGQFKKGQNLGNTNGTKNNTKEQLQEFFR